jgi:hypothetical protein
MSTLKVDSLVEKTSGNGVHIPGHVIQVVNMDTAAVTISTSSSLTGTDLLLDITPKFSTSKILVNINAHMSGNGTSSGFMRVLRDASTLISADEIFFSRTGDNYNMNGIQKLDSPNTTSTIQYRLWIRSNVGSIRFNQDGVSDMTLMEIAQ